MNAYLKNISLLIACCFLAACDDRNFVRFEHNLPAQSHTIPEFPQALRGNFFNEEDSCMLKITEHSVIRYNMMRMTIDSDIDTSEIQVNGGNIIRIGQKNGKDVLEVDLADTIFMLDAHHLLKPYKKYYFLNTKLDDTEWAVKCLYFQSGILELRSISEEDDLMIARQFGTVKKITNQDGDLKYYLVNMDKKGLKQFLGHGGFSNVQKFKRI